MKAVQDLFFACEKDQAIMKITNTGQFLIR